MQEFLPWYRFIIEAVYRLESELNFIVFFQVAVSFRANCCCIKLPVKNLSPHSQVNSIVKHQSICISFQRRNKREEGERLPNILKGEGEIEAHKFNALLFNRFGIVILYTT